MKLFRSTTLHPFSVSMLLFFFAASCSHSPSPTVGASPGRVRPAAFAGEWYPGNAKELRDFVSKQMSDTKIPALSGVVVGLIAPHAGYPYSGAVLGAAYRSVRGEDIRDVVLLGCPHRVPVMGAAVPEADTFETPLGKVRVNVELRKALTSRCDFVETSDAPHEKEHSLELQLPFLQVALTRSSEGKEFRILPILVGELSPARSEQLARTLVDLLAGKRALIVASSDLSHYPAYEDAKESDKAILAAATSLNAEQLSRKDESLLRGKIPGLECTMCGLNAVLVLERAARWMKVTEGKTLCCRNSGDVAVGDKARVVGYGAVAFLASTESGGRWVKTPSWKAEVDSPDESAEQVSVEGQKRLLEIARKNVEAAARREAEPDFKVEEQELTRKAGAFVTLKKHGELRGCIGVIEAIGPLWKLVAYAAKQAAAGDPRFEPVSPEEVAALHIEISVLSPVVPVKDLTDIKVGRDGLILRQGLASGLLLPQVAVEQKWDRDEFLAQTCRKAGLPPDAYRKGASLYKFTAQVFGEE